MLQYAAEVVSVRAQIETRTGGGGGTSSKKSGVSGHRGDAKVCIGNLDGLSFTYVIMV